MSNKRIDQFDAGVPVLGDAIPFWKVSTEQTLKFSGSDILATSGQVVSASSGFFLVNAQVLKQVFDYFLAFKESLTNKMTDFSVLNDTVYPTTQAVENRDPMYNKSNTDTQSLTCIINQTNGVAGFTRSIAGGEIEIFNIRNNKISAGMKVSPELEYDPDALGIPYIINTFIDDGSIKIKVSNLDSDNATNSTIFIKFKIEPFVS